MGDVEVINNPLGSSVLLDEDGNITSDDNRQEGSVAMNALGLGAAINDDMCILVCEFPINTVAGTDLAMSDRTGYVSSSGTSKFLVNAVAATDGDTIASPTITVKEDDASGKAVTAKDGAYTVTAGKRYYYSVAKSGYTTVTGCNMERRNSNYKKYGCEIYKIIMDVCYIFQRYVFCLFCKK